MRITPVSLSPYYQQSAILLQDQINSLPHNNRGYIQNVLSAGQKSQTMSMAIDWTHRLQQLLWAESAGALNSKILPKIEKSKSWKDYRNAPFNREQLANLANVLYQAGGDTTSSVLLDITDNTKRFGEETLKQCLMHDNDIIIHVHDPYVKNLLLNQATTEQAQKFARTFRAPWEISERRLTIKSEYTNLASFDGQIKDDIQEAFDVTSSELLTKSKSKLYTLTSLPCGRHARLDKHCHRELLDNYYHMVMVPKTDIKPINEALYTLFKQCGKDDGDVTIRNTHGTNLTFKIDPGTEVSSYDVRNVPGTEVYFAPVIDSFEGVFASKERYVYENEAMEDISMRFEKGRVVEYDARRGRNVLENLLQTDGGSAVVGEVGVGTNFNYTLDFQTSHNLPAEKRPGIHIALGKAVNSEFYGAQNGKNKSRVHKDLTLNMQEPGCEFWVNGIPVIVNGKFVLSGTEKLNQCTTLRPAV